MKLFQHKPAPRQALGTTSHTSCRLTQDAYFEKVDKGAGTVGTNAYKEMARRGTMIISLQDGFFKRMGFHADTVASMRAKILRGTYDGDVEGMLADSEEVDEDNMRAFDEYILTAYPFAEDAHELDKARSTVAPMAVDGDGAAASASASLNDGEWVLRELEHNLAKFKQTEAAFTLKKDELAKAEALYNSKARANADSATSGFCESVVQLIPFIADNDKLMTELAPKIETRRKQVATIVSCPVANVLVNLLVDLSALGATTASIRDDIERKASIVCGNEGVVCWRQTSHQARAAQRPRPRMRLLRLHLQVLQPVPCRAFLQQIQHTRSTRTRARSNNFWRQTTRSCLRWRARASGTPSQSHGASPTRPLCAGCASFQPTTTRG